MKNYTYCFANYSSATRILLQKYLQKAGWQQLDCHSNASLKEENIKLDESVLNYLEHKELLADLIADFNIHPLTYAIDDYTIDYVLSYIALKHYRIDGVLSLNAKDISWVVKPATMNNGEHIKIFHDFNTLKQYFFSNKRIGGAQVIQEYIVPQLWDNKKYALRYTVVVTNFKGVFVFKEGYVNVSGVEFARFSSDKAAHITNYYLDGQDTGVQQYTTTEFKQKFKGFDEKQIFSQLQLVFQQLINKFPRFLQAKTKSFEILGCDFITDDTGKPYLLEINHGPDFPTERENAMYDKIWDKFWPAVVAEFVNPIVANSTITGSDFIKLKL